MRGLLIDVNAKGYLDAILSVCLGPGWRHIWLAMKVPVYTFADFGLDDEMTDDLIWEFCQAESLVLFTDNRNEMDATSLGRAIKDRATVSSLPVFTPADSQRLMTDRRYAVKAAIRMMEIILDIEEYRGTGRMYLPKEM